MKRKGNRHMTEIIKEEIKGDKRKYEKQQGYKQK